MGNHMTSLYEDDEFPEEVDLVLRNCIFGFKCDKTWDSLSSTNDSNVRFAVSVRKRSTVAMTIRALLIQLH